LKTLLAALETQTPTLRVSRFAHSTQPPPDYFFMRVSLPFEP
jgi:hypothetical protein